MIMPQRVDRDLLCFDVQELYGVLAEVAAVRAVPFIVLLDEDVCGEAEQRGGFGKVPTMSVAFEARLSSGWLGIVAEHVR